MLQSEPRAAVMLNLGRENALYLNPYTGQVLGEATGRARTFFHFVEDLHRWLGMGGDNRPLGKKITGACNAAFMGLAISGVFLWWPRSWNIRRVRSVIFFHRGLKSRARNFNWHNTIGFWSSLLLIVITGTGMVISYQWATNLLYTLTGSEPPVQQTTASRSTPAQPSGEARERSSRKQVANEARSLQRPNSQSSAIPEDLDVLWLRAEQQANGWQSITLRLPLQQGAPVVFSIREGKAWLEAASSQLTLNPQSAEVIKWEPYAASSRGRQARTWARFLHTGEAGRLPGQVLAGLASLGGSLLVFTGFALAWQRFRLWAKRRQQASQRAELQPSLFETHRPPLQEEAD
jgi:uncharacterized iron-regulated membrane protein